MTDFGDGPALRWGSWVLLAGLLVYLCMPIFPNVFLDGDDAAVAAGTLQLSLHKNSSYDLVYSQSFLPGTYALLVGLHRLAGIDPHLGFTLLTVVGFVVFLSLGGAFVGRLSAIPFPLAVLVLLLFQETYSAAYFCNPSTWAGGLMIAALLLALHPSWRAGCAAGLVFAVAVWMRADVILVGLAFPALILSRDRSSLTRVAAFGSAFVAALVPLRLASGVGGGSEGVGALYAYHLANEAEPALTLVAYLSVFTGVVILLLVVGLVSSLRSRRPRILAVFLAGTLPLMLAYWNTFTTPRYFLYTLPFIAVPVALGLRQILSRRSLALSVAAVALFFGQYVLDPCRLLPCDAMRWTYEGPRMVSSILRGPTVWHGVKSVYSDGDASARRVLRAFLAEPGDRLLVAWQYPERKYLLYFLLREGYRCVDGETFEEGHLRTFQRSDNESVTVLSVLDSAGPTLPDSVRDRLQVEARGRLLYVGQPRDEPRLLDQPARALRLNSYPTIIEIRHVGVSTPGP